MNQLRYILYARKSSEEDDRQSLSIPAQIRSLKDKFHDINIVAVLEESQSAFDPGRPIFNKVIEMLENGEADGFLSWLHVRQLTVGHYDVADHAEPIAVLLRQAKRRR
jgi:DNA invertase Pin-like site-specific DNA recombinase